MDEAPSPARPTPEPIQGGATQIWHKRFPVDGSHRRYANDLAKLVIRTDGKISLAVKTTHIDPPQLNMRWVLAEIASVLRVIECIRSDQHKPVRYALAVELRYDDHTSLGVQPVVTGEWKLTRLEDESGHWGGLVDSDPKFLGPFEIGTRDDANAFLGERLLDLFDLCGLECPCPDIAFEI
jgi:hypothetical protein